MGALAFVTVSGEGRICGTTTCQRLEGGLEHEREPLPADGLRLLEEQLGRMRGMLYHYYDQFYRFLYISLILLFALIAIALAGLSA